jgi:DNA-directed RNA polymerase subunit M/transcription elongation factor TFIIS
MPERIFDPEKEARDAEAAKKKAAQDWLDRTVPNLTCPACGQKGHAVKDFALLQVSNLKNYWRPGDDVLRTVVVACNTCSYLWFFSTEAMNVP